MGDVGVPMGIYIREIVIIGLIVDYMYTTHTGLTTKDVTLDTILIRP